MIHFKKVNRYIFFVKLRTEYEIFKIRGSAETVLQDNNL